MKRTDEGFSIQMWLMATFYLYSYAATGEGNFIGQSCNCGQNNKHLIIIHMVGDVR